jgi:hypothetical protein
MVAGPSTMMLAARPALMIAVLWLLLRSSTLRRRRQRNFRDRAVGVIFDRPSEADHVGVSLVEH